MTSDSERVAALFDGTSAPTPTMPERNTTKPVSAPRVGHRYVNSYAPPMPESFWGKVAYAYQGGKLVNIVVEETFRP